MTISEKIHKALNKSGVYLFKDKANQIIYVGRSVNLKERLKSYLNPQDPKTIELIAEAKNISIKTTLNLIEMIVLEANLIKKYEPKYNIREKDNRSFVYIVIPKKSWTYPLLIRGQELKRYQPINAEIFGPFKSLSLTKKLLLILRKAFPYSTCRLNQSKPCFHYQIGLCPGKCVGIISENEYKKIIDNLISFLKNEKKFPKLVALKNIDDSILITQEQGFSKFSDKRIEGYDISHFSGKESIGAMVVSKNGEFDKTQYRLFKIKTAKPNDDVGALKEVISRRIKHKEWKYPDLILVDGGKGQINSFEKILKQNNINIPVVGIAKFRNDRIIFGKLKKSLKEIISLSFRELQKIRNEAHRFSNSARKRILQKSYKIV